MKQHITLEQLKELSEDQFVKLYKLIRAKEVTDKRIAGFYDSIIIGGGFGYKKLLSEINIGKMIEILKHQKTFNDTFEIGYECYSRDELDLFTLSNGVGYYNENISLCDLLWEAIVNEIQTR